MASNFQGDVPGNRYFASAEVGSAASNAANARLTEPGVIGPFPWDIRLRTMQYIPTQGNAALSTATSSATYRRLSVYNGGTIGTVTATASRIASLNMTVSLASFSSRAMTVSTAVSLASGEMMYASHETVGGQHANGTILLGGNLAIGYEII